MELNLDLKQFESFVNDYQGGEKPRGFIDTQTVQNCEYIKLGPSNIGRKGPSISRGKKIFEHV